MCRRLALALLLGLVLAPVAPVARAAERPRWIVVTAPAFDDVVGDLCDHRRTQGFEVTRIRMDPVRGDADGPWAGAARLRVLLGRLARQAGGPCYVLLVGNARAADPTTVVPPLPGTVADMRGVPTDNAYGCLDGDLLADVAVGRFPARTVEEARAMIEKTIRFETSPPPGVWRDRLSLLVGHPGGGSPIERRLATWVVNNAVGSRFDNVHPRWLARAIVHMDASPFCVPDADLDVRSRDLLREGQLFSIYLGHANAGGLGSSGVHFLDREVWARADLGARVGIHMSCGCHTCELEGWMGEGFSLFGLRNPAGPVAAIGAHGESYGAMGKLAFEGLLPLLAAARPPTRLGDWYLAVKRGIAEGPIGGLEFFLFDNADGTGGRMPLEIQRRMHLEMWMLLGDPALALPLTPPDLDLAAELRDAPKPGIVFRAALPPRLGTGPVDVTVRLERPFGTAPAGLQDLPAAPGPSRAEAMRERYRRANDVVEHTVRLTVADRQFHGVLPLPEGHGAWGHVVVRAHAAANGAEARGAIRVDLAR